MALTDSDNGVIPAELWQSKDTFIGVDDNAALAKRLKNMCRCQMCSNSSLLAIRMSHVNKTKVQTPGYLVYAPLEPEGEGRGAMAGARGFANVATCCVSSRLARCRIFRRVSCFSPLNTGTL